MQKNIPDEINQESMSTIFVEWADIVAINAYSMGSRTLLKHYLQSVELLTRKTFFQKGSVLLGSESFDVSKGTLTKLHDLHAQLGTLEIKRSSRGFLYAFPQKRPGTKVDWYKVQSGFLAIKRSHLLNLIEGLSDNELRVYFSLRRIFEANRSDRLGVETWPKVLRSSHIIVSQDVLSSSLKSLEQKGLVSLATPILKASRLKNRFLFVVNDLEKVFPETVNRNKSESNLENRTEISLNHNKSAHIKKAVNKDFNLNQSDDSKNNENSKSEDLSDFNFYGLDKLERPLLKTTVRSLISRHGLEESLVQESVMRFSKYYKSHNVPLLNPVGFLVRHLTQFKTMFVEPEWFLEQGRVGEQPKSLNIDCTQRPSVGSNRKDLDGIGDVKMLGTFFGELTCLLDQHVS